MEVTKNPKKLALDGGEPAVSQKLPQAYPGGLRIGEDEEQEVLDTLRKRRLFRYYGPEPGPSKVDELEAAFRKVMDTPYSLAVTSGTAALICSLVGMGIGPGDEVIIPAFTWIASASAVAAVGAVPVIAEVDDSLTLDPADVELKISPYTKAIMPVHMRGVPCQMDKLMEVAKKNSLQVIEDTAQADGASFRGKRLGTFGDAGAFSLQFNKIITSGEGGMLVANDQKVFERALMYHDVIGGKRNHIPEADILPGINYRMPELLAAVMLAQLKRLDGLLTDMRQRKALLIESIRDISDKKGVTFQRVPDVNGDAGLALIFMLPDAEKAQLVTKALSAEGAQPWLLYSPEVSDYHVYSHWAPIMNQRTWSKNGGPWKNHPRKIKYEKDMCPQTLNLLGRSINLHVSPDLTNSNIEELAEAVYKVFSDVL